MTRRRVVALLCGACSVALAACAIPTQSTPSVLPPSHVPSGLLDHNLPTTTSTTQPTPSASVHIYLLNVQKQLTPIERFETPPAALTAILKTLVQGPTSQESAQNIGTAIPNTVRVLSVSGPTDQVTVNLNTAFDATTGDDIELAVAQIVATVAAVNGPNTGVLFQIDGIPISVPVANGQEVLGPVTLGQFVTLP
jgi:hypothetical protein